MKHRLLRDGKMLWRLGGGKQVEVHVALFTDLIVLMQQQEGKLVLRSHDVAVASNLKIYHGPVIKLQKLIVQPYAAGMYCPKFTRFCTFVNLGPVFQWQINLPLI